MDKETANFFKRGNRAVQRVCEEGAPFSVQLKQKIQREWETMRAEDKERAVRRWFKERKT